MPPEPRADDVAVLVLRVWVDSDGRLVSRHVEVGPAGRDRTLATVVGVDAAVDEVRRWLRAV
jgi:hypothetical protein